MKQSYRSPEVEIEILCRRDVLLTSGTDDEEAWGPLYPMQPTFS